MDVAVILAAGEGTRMKSKTPKILHKLCGKEMIKYVVETAKNAGIEKTILILGHNEERVKQVFDEEHLLFEKQPIYEGAPYGTGFAVMQSKKHIEDDDTVVILSGDVPLIKEKTLRSLIAFHKLEKNAVSILTAELERPHGYGRIIRNSDTSVEGIVEEKDATEAQKTIKEINSGIYCFEGKALIYALEHLKTDNAQKEYYLTDAVAILKQINRKAGGFKTEDSSEISGVNNRLQLSQLQKIKRNQINEKHMLNGVTILDPDHTYIDDEVIIQKDVTIFPNSYLEGSTLIGEDSVIGPDTRISNSSIGNNVKVEYSNVLDSIIGNHTSVGPYAYLRPASELGEYVKIGDFVEVKNTKIGNYSKASHLAYLGDGDVGENVNIGCGVIFANYNGQTKNITKIGNNAFIGSNSNLIAPIIIEEGAYVASGSTITENVEKNALAIARARQVNKNNWKKESK